MKLHFKILFVLSIFGCITPFVLYAQQNHTDLVLNATTDSAKRQNRFSDSAFVREHYKKLEVMIPMRDKIKLFTSIYVPKDSLLSYPIMLLRTPYNVEPYGRDNYLKRLGPSRLFTREGFIFVYQDVRGKYMSEGNFIAVRPFVVQKTNKNVIDETTDTYDTIDWLIKNLPRNNGKVGIWGISAEGFYASSAAIDAHPALKAVSPQAPVTDWFMGDDRHHNGVFQEQGSFTYLSSFGKTRRAPTTKTAPQFTDYGTNDIYNFYLNMGPLKNFDNKIFHHTNLIWNDIMDHGSYDSFWQIRTPVSYLKHVKPAIMVVGGFFDQEDLYGALKTHSAIEKGGHLQQNILVMGPWVHGGFSRFDGDSIAAIKFGEKTGAYFREQIEFPFFMHFLKGTPDPKIPNVMVFETGTNLWRKYNTWPAALAVQRAIFLNAGNKLSFDKPRPDKEKFNEFTSDPAKPVPYTAKVAVERGSDFMVEDQRFTSGRSDVLSFQSGPLNTDVTLSGPVKADLFVSTTGTDADFVVKVIDIYPENYAAVQPGVEKKMDGYQQLVRGEIMRSKFRKSFAAPEPMKPGKITEVKWDMEDVNHCFLKGHRIMIQIQSSWFPLNDRNPQTFTDIYKADETQFHKAVHRIYFSPKYPSHINVLTITPH